MRPGAILCGSRSAELAIEQVQEIAGCRKSAVVIDVEGDDAMQMENAAGLTQALSTFAAQAVKN